MPTSLRNRIGLRPLAARALDRKTQRLEHLADMAGVVGHGKRLGNDPGNHGQSPHGGGKAIRHRPAVAEVIQPAQLRGGECLGAPGAMAFQPGLSAVGLVLLQPQRYAGTWRPQEASGLSAGVLLMAQQDRMETAGNTVGPVCLGRTLERGKLPSLLGRRVNESRPHTQRLPPDWPLVSLFTDQSLA